MYCFYMTKLCRSSRILFKNNKRQLTLNHLEDVNILDLSSILAGPFCTQNLSDLSANIIKVEKPQGDDTRQWGPPFIDEKLSSYFVSANRNKKSLKVDLKQAEGAEIVRDLAINWADILVENFIPNKLKKYKLDYASLSKLNPQLIYASLSGYGQHGPLANKPGYDIMIAAQGGLMSFTGTKTESVKVGVAMTDLATGLYMQGAILAALYQRTKTNKGQHIDVSLLSCQVSLLANIGQNYLITNKLPQRHGTQHESIVPYQKFETKDKEIIVGALNDAQWHRLVNVIEIMFDDKKSSSIVNSLKTQSLFGTNPLRVKNRSELIPLLEDCFKEYNSQQWLDKLENNSIPCAPLASLNDVFYKDEQVAYLNSVEETNNIKTIRHPIRYNNNAPNIRFLPPHLGQHSEEILKSILSYDDEKIMKLKEKGVI